MTNPLKFIQVGDLCKEITENALPPTNALAGRTMGLYFEDGTTARIQFDSMDALNWEIVEGGDRGCCGTATYRATCPRDGIYLVDYIRQDLRAASVSLIIDVRTRKAGAVTGTLPTKSETRKDAFSRVQADMALTSVTTRFLRAAIDTPFTSRDHPHGPTDELVGKRVKYVYSRTEAYEHIYLNQNLYTWHCLEGVEKGLADTDRCDYYKIDEALYLFVWREKIVPTLGVLLIDFLHMKTTGKIFGYENDDFCKLTNAPIGAYATELNMTRHERGAAA